MKHIKNLLFIALCMLTAMMFGQKTVTGTVIDELGQPLPDASIVEQGTSNGVATDFDGNFTLRTKKNKGNLVISFMGYKVKVLPIKANLGKIALQPDANALEEVVIVGKGVVDLVKERETPVAVSTIKAVDIQEKSGNLEFPELMKATPSVYTTKSGGLGESEIYLRGFDNANIAIIINGQPVNDMEGGKVYWSNWSGLTAVASGVQIQRGLGASKLAVPSVGGTINVVTKSAEKQEGGFAQFIAGNDNYFKTTIAYNTGLSKSGWAASVLFSRMQEDGYIDATKGEGYSYFVALGHKLNEKHSFNLSFIGAAQWHHQRKSNIEIKEFLKRGSTRYNSDWGYLNNEEYSLMRNFYNKPISSLNWDWSITDRLSLSTVLYASWGRGGGASSKGKADVDDFRDPKTGLISFDKIVANNRSMVYRKSPDYIGFNNNFAGKYVGANDNIYQKFDNTYKKVEGINGNVFVRLGNMNSHDWYGGISNLKYELEDWAFSAGIDLRTYTGYHYNTIADLLGLDAYYSTGDRNIEGHNYYGQKIVDKEDANGKKNKDANGNPIKEEKYYPLNGGKFVTQTINASPLQDTGLQGNYKVNYYSMGHVNWYGTNGVVEYNNHDSFSAVVQFGISDKSYQRVDLFDQPNNEVSAIKHLLGGYTKGGLNFNITDEHNIFANAGLIKRQPDFGDVFPNYQNKINDKVRNQTIISYELGYGLKSSILNANVNLYHSTWKDRTLKNKDYKTGKTTSMPNVTQVHKGIEVEFNTKPIESLKIKGAFSYGDWRYKGDITADIFDRNQQPDGHKMIYLDGVKVGNSAQLTANLGLIYHLTEKFKVDVDWNYTDNLYAGFKPEKNKSFEHKDNLGALRLPSFNLFDLGASYKFQFTDKYSLAFRVNVNNLLDTEYIQNSSTTIHAKKDSELYKGKKSNSKGS